MSYSMPGQHFLARTSLTRMPRLGALDLVIRGSHLYLWLFLDLVVGAAGASQGSQDESDLVRVDLAESAEAQRRPVARRRGGVGWGEYRLRDETIDT
jgi:hypothetical protein